MRALLGRTIQAGGTKPEYLICDSGPQFDNDGFRDWCEDKNIRPRYGAVGRHGSIAVVERFILTLQTYLLSRSTIVPLRRQKFCRELSSFCDWYNAHRPHTTLIGCTPNEVYSRRFPAHRKTCWGTPLTMAARRSLRSAVLALPGSSRRAAGPTGRVS